MPRRSVLLRKTRVLDCIAFLVAVVNAVISLNKLKLVSFYIVTYLLQQCIDLGLGCYKHNVPQLRSSQLWSGIRHKYVFHSHEEKSAKARNEGWRSGHSPLGRGLDACHILQGTLVAINQSRSQRPQSFWSALRWLPSGNEIGDKSNNFLLPKRNWGKCFVKFLLYQAFFPSFFSFLFLST